MTEHERIKAWFKWANDSVTQCEPCPMCLLDELVEGIWAQDGDKGPEPPTELYNGC